MADWRNEISIKCPVISSIAVNVIFTLSIVFSILYGCKMSVLFPTLNVSDCHRSWQQPQSKNRITYHKQSSRYLHQDWVLAVWGIMKLKQICNYYSSYVCQHYRWNLQEPDHDYGVKMRKKGCRYSPSWCAKQIPTQTERIRESNQGILNIHQEGW